ncbi:phage terminase large subunit [Allochromatium humboldtianum]|uniref:Phage terminase large subunit n=1 Tax=Allochromatium humboldtianum TaxID=504901 RepID=A0A850RAM8_9GAMM|nr:phage terminase large subunit [Allochromatium humboldtianum]NVZ08010.1 phage terminase large subunit [Allochromatium humboldtianum]
MSKRKRGAADDGIPLIDGMPAVPAKRKAMVERAIKKHPKQHRTCPECGGTFFVPRGSEHRHREVCDLCAAKIPSPTKPRKPKPCVDCGEDFVPLKAQEKRCCRCQERQDQGLIEQAIAVKTQTMRDEHSVKATQGPIDLVRRELVARELASRKLMAFVVRMQSDYQPGWVHKDIAERLERFLEDVVNKRSPRLMIQMPPRLGKSTLASHMFPAWALGRRPEFEVITCSYSASLAMEFSRKVRAMLREDAFKVVFPECKLDEENQNAEGWRTTRRGGFLPAGVGGAITGKGAHILIIDDPIKNSEEAESETIRESIKAWYQSTAYTRLAPGGGVLIIQTRWHTDDLSGWLEDEMRQGQGDTFEIVRYPMIAIEDETYRRKGEALHPERRDLQESLRIKQAVGPRVWAALYQQDPQADGGQYFSRDMFKFYTPPAPPRLAVYAAFDLAIGKNDRNDFTVGAVIGVDANDDIWVLDIVRGRWDSHRIVEEILQVQRVWKPVMIGLEKGHISMAIGPYLDKRIAEEKLYETNIKDLPPGRRDKLSRARAIQGRMRQGKVKFPQQAEWLDPLMSEMLAFPDGRHDDQVDALAYLGQLLSEMTTPHVPSAKSKARRSWRDKLRQFVPSARAPRTPMSA